MGSVICPCFYALNTSAISFLFINVILLPMKEDIQNFISTKTKKIIHVLIN